MYCPVAQEGRKERRKEEGREGRKEEEKEGGMAASKYVEGRVYYRSVGDHSQRQTHLGKSICERLYGKWVDGTHIQNSGQKA